MEEKAEKNAPKKEQLTPEALQGILDGFNKDIEAALKQDWEGGLVNDMKHYHCLGYFGDARRALQGGLAKFEASAKDEAAQQALAAAAGEFIRFVGLAVSMEKVGYLDPSDKAYGKRNPVYWTCRKTLLDMAERYESPYLNVEKLVEDKLRGISIARATTDSTKKELEFAQAISNIVAAESDSEKKEERMKTLHEFAKDTHVEDAARDREFIEMAMHRDYCEHKVWEAFQTLNDMDKGNLPCEEKGMEELREKALIACVGVRFLGEMEMAKRRTDPNRKTTAVDLIPVHPAFKMKNDRGTGSLLPNPEKSEEDRKQFFAQIDAIVAAIDQMLEKPNPKMKGAAGAKNFASLLYRKYGHTALFTKGPENSGQLQNILDAGKDHTLVLTDRADTAALAGTGTTEYNGLHEAYAAYVEASQIPGNNCEKQVKAVYDAAKNYLDHKATVPHSTKGKERVRAANRLFTQAALHRLLSPDKKDIKNDREREEVLKELQVQMMRSPECIRLVTKNCADRVDSLKNNPWAAKAFLFARYCDEKIRKENVSNGVIFPGKLKTGDMQRDFTMQDTISSQRSGVEYHAYGGGKTDDDFKDATPAQLEAWYEKGANALKTGRQPQKETQSAAIGHL